MKFRFLCNLLLATVLLVLICPTQVGCNQDSQSKKTKDGEARYLPKSPRIDKNKPTVVYSENDEQ